MTKYLFFIAYGKADIFRECKYALLRLIAVYEAAGKTPPEIILYTDRPEEFSFVQDRLTLHTRKTGMDQIQIWRGKYDFVFRPKIEMLREVTRTFEGKLLYVDCDTYCLQTLDGLFDTLSDKAVVMHNCEGSIGEAGNIHLKKWRSFLKKQLPDALEMDMWNAGTIGFSPMHAPLLKEVLGLTDGLYPRFPRHTVEQFAFGYTFQWHGLRIHAAAPYLFHYWNLKEFRVVLERFFEKYTTPDEMLSNSARILPEIIHPDKMAYERISSFRRRIMKLRGRDWKIAPYLSLMD
ncbi:MAG TPA: hypothetical protein VL547_01555 [Dinghuibacter sp.]|uniref:hypothetical protein n=1 Tax=Dinghuibacter sp. TaxID=2024697 RepID=UPI002C46AC4F|nr:hypothetical protein [Dinghuibacter sp.]HTJ10674.1 hypothetical protein [Dinghuibacter sp.]